MDILGINNIKSTMTLNLAVFILLKQKSSIAMKTSRHFVSWLLSGSYSFIIKQEWIFNWIESKNILHFDTSRSGNICCYTNPNSFFIALMLAFFVFGCCGRPLNFGRFTFTIKVSVIFQRNAHYRSSCTVLSHRQSKLKCVLQLFFTQVFTFSPCTKIRNAGS